MENPLFWSSIWFRLVRPVWKVQVATAVWNSVKLAILLPCSFKHVGMKQFERGAGVADVHDRVELEQLPSHPQRSSNLLLWSPERPPCFQHEGWQGPIELAFELHLHMRTPISNEARVFQLPSHVRELFQSAWRALLLKAPSTSGWEHSALWLRLVTLADGSEASAFRTVFLLPIVLHGILFALRSILWAGSTQPLEVKNIQNHKIY